MGISQYLSKFALGVNSQGVLSAAKGGTGTTTGGSGGPKITGIVVTDSSYVTIDDTAVNITGGYIKITGSGFASGCQVLVGTVAATSVTFISATEVRAQVPATAAGTYIVYLVNSDGGVAIRVNGITFSATPTWVSSSSLSGAVNSAISLQLVATGATTFALASGSSLPSGVFLSSGGLITGTVTGISSETTYNFTVVATDAELQDSPQAFAFTITAGDPYFKYNTLLLSANSTNNAQNNTFLDSSTNNFAITRNGNTTQGTFSPYGANWSNYFDGAGDYLNTPTNAAFTFGTGDLTLECWIYQTANSTSTYRVIFADNVYGSTGGYTLYSYNNALNLWKGGSEVIAPTGTITLNNWTHVAWTRSGSANRLFINGTQVGATTTDATNYTSTASYIGASSSGTFPFVGYISNARIVKGTAVYTSAFTPSTTPLTAISGTSLLTCQSNRFIDNSTNAFTITRNGDTSVQRFSPFSPTQTYSAGTIGGSGYFDGAGDYLTVPTTTALSFGTGDFTVEVWVYKTAAENASVIDARADPGTASPWGFFIDGSNFPYFYNGTTYTSAVAITLNAWNHIAGVRESGGLSIYVNGARGLFVPLTASLDRTAGAFIGMVANTSSPTAYWRGYLSNLRVVKGTAVYTGSTYTVPTTPLTAIANTSLLLNYTNAGVYDAAMMNNLETVGDAKISTAQSKFGGSSMYFDGAGDYLLAPNNPIYNFGSGEFTIEMWVNRASAGAGDRFLISRNNGTDFLLRWNSGGVLQLYIASSLIASYTWNFTIGTWYHLAVVRNGPSAVTIYIDGTSVATGTSSTNMSSTSPLLIGGYIGSDYYNGYIDDLRITRSVARYTTNFTPLGAAPQQ